jgi:hypothetical protein
MLSPEFRDQGGESLPKKDPLLVRTVDNVIKEVLLLTTPLTIDRISKRQGMTVRNIRREGEDPEADIDIETEKSIGESLDQLGQKYGISFQVYSEHHNFTTGSRPPYYPTSIDPTENTDELVKGLSNFYVTPWTILGVYDLDNNPIGAGAVNLAHPNDSFVVRDGKNYHHVIADLRSKDDVEFSPQPLVESVRDPRLVIATYRAKEKYDLEFLKYFSKLKQERHLSSTIISTGGNYMYVPISLGFVHVYIAPIEPYEEVFAGLPFLLAQGGEVRIIPPEGESIGIKSFQPELQRERANLLLASRSTKLLNQLEKYYRDRREELRSQ